MLESGEADGSRGVMQLRGSHSVPRETRYVLGGLHLTAPSFVAASLLKVEPATKQMYYIVPCQDLTATEYSGALDMRTLAEMELEDIDTLQVRGTEVAVAVVTCFWSGL